MTERFCKKCNKMCHCTNADSGECENATVVTEKKTPPTKVVVSSLTTQENANHVNN